MTAHDHRQAVVIFGTERFASLAWYCLTHDSPYRVCAFTVDAEYRHADEHHGLPVVSFEELEEHFPPDEVQMLVPLGYSRLNAFRTERYQQAKARGYDFISYVSSRASVWPDLDVGENSMIYEHAIIQPFARIGNNTIIRSGAHISHHAVVGDNCFIAAHAVLAGGTAVQDNCFVGLNATLRDNITIAPRCFIAAGALIIHDTEENGMYMGVPGKRNKTPADKIPGL